MQSHARTDKKHKISSCDPISRARAGLRRDELDALAQKFDVSLKALVKMLPVSYRTMLRLQPHELLSKDISDYILRMQKVYDRTLNVFGTRAKALKWLNTPLLALGSAKPIDIFDTHSGIDRVLEVLIQIEHGVVS